MGIEENKRAIQRYFGEIMNDGDFSKVDEIIHEEYVGSSVEGLKGVEAIKQFYSMLRSISSDAQITIQDMIAEGDRIAVFNEWNLTHDGGEWAGVPGTGRKITAVIVSVYEFKDGKVFRGNMNPVINQLDLFQKQGVLPPTEEILKAYNDSLK
jgi:predicted ester cyclase